jgi:hypothetical protein
LAFAEQVTRGEPMVTHNVRQLQEISINRVSVQNRVPRSKMPRSRLRRGQGHPWPRSSSNGLRRRGPRHGLTGIGRSALWHGVGPLGPPLSEPPPVRPRPGFAAPRICCLLPGSTWGALGCPAIPVPLSAACILDHSGSIPPLAHCTTAAAHAHQPLLSRPIVCRNAMADSYAPIPNSL